MRFLWCCGAPSSATGLLAGGIRPWQSLGTGISNGEHLWFALDMGWEEEINGIAAKSLPGLQLSAHWLGQRLLGAA